MYLLVDSLVVSLDCPVTQETHVRLPFNKHKVKLEMVNSSSGISFGVSKEALEHTSTRIQIQMCVHTYADWFWKDAFNQW